MIHIIKITQYTFYKEKLPEKYVFVENGDIEGYIKDYLSIEYGEEKKEFGETKIQDFANLLLITKQETFESLWQGKTDFEIIEVENGL